MRIRPYGDTANDGMVQLSFTLPLPLGARAREAARRYAMLMGISNPLVAHAESADTNFSFFVVYGACSHTIDPEQILVDELAHGELDYYAINNLIEQQLGRRITVIGAFYLTFVCLIPEFLFYKYNLSFSLGGTSILIVVSVTMDTVAQIQSHLLAHQYEGLIKKSRMRGGRR